MNVMLHFVLSARIRKDKVSWTQLTVPWRSPLEKGPTTAESNRLLCGRIEMHTAGKACRVPRI